MLHAILASHLTFLSEAKLRTLAFLCRCIHRKQIPGRLVETGCALGGSAILLAAIKDVHRPLYIYDVFGMIPPPSGKDGRDVLERYETILGGKSAGIGGNRYYGYEENLVDKVKASFRSFGYPVEENNVHLVKGLVSDTLDICEPVSLAHIDVDWYEPVYTSLERITPWLSVGGVMVLDDYHYWSGAKQAVDEYFSDKQDAFSFDKSRGTMIVIRNRPQ